MASDLCASDAAALYRNDQQNRFALEFLCVLLHRCCARRSSGDRPPSMTYLVLCQPGLGINSTPRRACVWTARARARAHKEGVGRLRLPAGVDTSPAPGVTAKIAHAL